MTDHPLPSMAILLLSGFTSFLQAQGPTITGIFPSGGAPGTTTEVRIFGGGISSVQNIFIEGEGLTAEFEPQVSSELRIKKWFLSGPFRNENDKGFDKPYPPELSPFNRAQTFKDKDNKNVGWKEYDTSVVSVVAIDEVYPGDNLVAYAYGELELPDGKKHAQFVIRADDGVKVWVNGRLSLTSHQHKPMSQHRRVFLADLKKGKNAILVKVDQGVGEWQFDLYQTDEVELPGKGMAREKCASCHAYRGPENRSMSPGQWRGIVRNMINRRRAPIKENEAQQIIQYFRAEARKRGLTARIHIDKDAAAGDREIRIATMKGVSTAWTFEVGPYPEVVDSEPNDEATPQKITFPIIVNGQVGSPRDVDVFEFQAKEGQRLVFIMRAFRLNETSQSFFNSWISLRNAKGEELDRNAGHFSFDPMIDYVFDEDGTYRLEVRDLLWRGSPACIYRLSMGEIPYNTYIFPAGGKPGQKITAAINGENLKARNYTFTVPARWGPGIHKLGTPYGIFDFYVGENAEFIDGQLAGAGPLAAGRREPRKLASKAAAKKPAPPQHAPKTDLAKASPRVQWVNLPASINGRIALPGETDRYRFKIRKSDIVPIPHWWVIFPFQGTEKGIDEVFPPEKEIDLKKVYSGKRGRPVKWYKRGKWGSGSFFTNAPEAHSVGYAFTHITLPEERDSIMQLGSSDAVKVWLNGEVVWVNNEVRRFRWVSDVVPVHFRKGKNKLLVKVENIRGGWGLNVQFDGYTFEALTRAIHSPLNGFLSLHEGNGRTLATSGGSGARENPRLEYSFRQPGQYEIRVSDAVEGAGENYLYRLNISPLDADFGLQVSPDNPNVARGGTLPLQVRVTRRKGFSVPIELEVRNLPRGIKASRTSIPIDQTEAYITLTADGSAPFNSRQIEVIGKVHMGKTVIERKAVPFQVYRTNNRPQRLFRTGMACSVVNYASFALAIREGYEFVFTRDKPEVEFTVKADRSADYRRQIVLQMGALPSGIRGPRTIVIGPKKNSAKIRLRAVTDEEVRQGKANLFVGKTPGTGTYQMAVLGRLGRDVYLSAPAITLKVLADAERTKKGHPEPRQKKKVPAETASLGQAD